MKKILSLLLSVAMFFSMATVIFANNEIKSEAENDFASTLDAASIVLMEAETGKILLSKNADIALPPASVTKIMTLLLVAEALDSGAVKLSDTASISSEAAAMGGSQVYLKEGEVLTVEELIKCTVIASANDAAVALAEMVAGSEQAFVSKMNSRASELGMHNSCFENVTGLDDTVTNHVISAKDIAIMSRELIKHEVILRYSSVWQDSIRNGEFVLTNTNRLVRFYDGCTGLKTGSTDKAGYCISTTAKRGDMHLIAVVMGAKTRDARNEIARKMLDYGFSSYSLFSASESTVKEIPITFAERSEVMLYSAPIKFIVPSSKKSDVEAVYTIPEVLQAPIRAGDPVGKVEYFLDEEKLGETPIYANESVERISLWQLYVLLLTSVLGVSAQ